MPAVNDTKFQHAVFFLTGIFRQENIHVWISIPFSLMYVTSILGNSVILFIIKSDPILHEPIYLSLSVLAITDLGLSISTLPTILSIFWFNSREISHDACFAQLLFIHSLTFTESPVLWSMVFDHFVANCDLLRYDSILTLLKVAKMGLVSLLRGVFLNLQLPMLLTQYRYCQANILSHSNCMHQEVMTMACSDIRVNIIYGFFVTVNSVELDFLLILLFYVMILKTVLNTASHAEHLKTLNTCVSHVCFVLLSYMPGISLSVIHRSVKSSSPLVQNVLGNVSLLIPPLMNPIVYSMKTKHIRARIIRVFIK